MAWGFASKESLLVLRKEGVVQQSTWVNSLLVVLCWAGFLGYSIVKLVEFFQKYYDQFTANQLNLAVGKVILSQFITDYLVIPSSLILVAMLSLILLQTRFYWNFSAISFDLNKLSWSVQNKQRAPIKKLLFLGGMPFILLSFVATAYFIGQEISKLFVTTRLLNTTELLKLAEDVFSQIAILMVLLIILGILLDWFYFRVAHFQVSGQEESDFSKHRAIDSIK